MSNVQPIRQTWLDHAAKISAAWQKGVESILETGECLSRAKCELSHGSFEDMVEANLPFGPRTARMLMAVATNNVLSNRKHVSVLPPSWGTLNELNKIPQSLLLEKIEEGAVHPKMTRKEVKALLPPKQREDDLPPEYEGSAKSEVTHGDQSPWSAHKQTKPDDDMPTSEEADESYQETCYDQACLILEEMSGATRQRFFAHFEETYGVEYSSYTKAGRKGFHAESAPHEGLSAKGH